jgi:hypothetical protein
MHSEVQLITPEKASQLLLINTSNRHLTRSNVDFFAKELKDGRWKLTHQGIAITESGKLADGQHRLTAVVETGIAAPMLVTTGLEDDAFAVLDSGRSRMASDVLSIEGGKYSHISAAAVRLLILYENSPNIVWVGKNAKIANAAILARFLQDAQTWERISGFVSLQSSARILLPGPFACMAFMAEKKGVDFAVLQQLAFDLRNGANLPPGDPALAYRNKLSFGERSSGQSRLADYIKLLNAKLQGQTLKIFKQQQFPPMPVIQY